MPTNVTTNPRLIHVGRGDIYIGVTVPVTPPVALVNGIPATGTLVGATLDPAQMIYRPTVFPIETQQSTTEVGHVITKEELTLEFTIGEITYTNLFNLIIGAGSAAGASIVTVGGNIIPPTTAVLIVAPRRDGGYLEAMLYQAVMTDDRTFAFDRSRDMRPRIIARAEGVLTRTQGDQLGFFAPVVVSA